VIVAALNQSEDHLAIKESKKEFAEKLSKGSNRLALAVDNAVDVNDLYQVAWQVLGNSDPLRDAELIAENLLYIDGTAKVHRAGGFTRGWPNVVCSSVDTIDSIDKKWESLGIGSLIPSPSLKNSRSSCPGKLKR